jgi:diaminopimelate epimerase
MNTFGLKFLKVSGTGNDFIIVLNLKDEYNYNWSNLACILCRRRFSVGADGLVVLEKSKKADARMKIFNPDGSEAEMCGNAARCAAGVLVRERITSSNNVNLETLSGIITAEVKGNNVKIKMTQPHSFRDEVHIRINSIDYKGGFINTGVPHAVFFVKDVKKIDLLNVAPKIRHDKQFQPEGTNVNFVQVLSNGSISVRTYERGVENETYACGTGAVASSIIGHLKGLLQEKRIKVLTKGGELSVELEEINGEIKNVYLESPVKIVYSAEYLGEGENV